MRPMSSDVRQTCYRQRLNNEVYVLKCQAYKLWGKGLAMRLMSTDVGLTSYGQRLNNEASGIQVTGQRLNKQ